MIPDECELGGSSAAPRVRPLLISKVNTVAMFALAAGALTGDAWGVPGPDAVHAGVMLVASTTVASSAAYAHNIMRGSWRA
jgi:fatty acid desaturase